MNTQRHEIIKLPTETPSAKESTPLRSYVVRNIEILKSIIISIEITKEAIAPMIPGLMVVVILDINLRCANLQGTNLDIADFRGSDLRRANLANANLTNSCYDSLTFFDKKIQPYQVGMRAVKTADKCF